MGYWLSYDEGTFVEIKAGKRLVELMGFEPTTF
jgi:hypothetical protein